MNSMELSASVLKAEKDYQEQLNFINDISSDSLIAKGRHNLTKNKIEYYFANNDEAFVINPGANYDDAVESFCQMASTIKTKNELRAILDRRNLLNSFARGDASFSCKYERKKEGKPTIWVLTTCKTFMNQTNGDIMCFMYSYDITDSVIEQRIIEKIAYVEYDFIGIIDLDSSEIYVRNSDGHRASDVIEDHHNDYASSCEASIKQVVVPEQRARMHEKTKLNVIINNLNEKGTYFITYQMINGEGKIIHKKIRYAFLDDMKDKILVMRSDITGMYEAEQEQIKRIESALRIAENASRAKSEFLSRVSHDLRTPMNVILGLSNLALECNNLEECKDYINKIHTSGQYLLNLINDTLDVSKIESEKIEIRTMVISNMELFNSIVEPATVLARQKGITLNVSRDNFLPAKVKVDIVHIRQIMNNLISNAIKFTPAGGHVDLNVTVKSRENNIIHTVITVSDSGIGMSKEFLRKMYDPFVQEHAKGTVSGEGSGLGLTIVKKLVELLDGRIEAESEEHKGTTFKIYLDIERVAVCDEEIEASKPFSTDVLKGKNILLCEDHPMNAMIAEKLLKKVGSEVSIAKNGKIGVDLFRSSEEGHFDAIIMDIRMPVMDGLEATGHIRALDRADAEAVPIVAMTANAFDVDEEKSLAAGMNAHLAKPIVPILMYQTLVNLIKD